MKKIPLIVIGGPTASGKTKLSIEIAKKYDAEIVSADSMQIYKYMDIGTAKPTLEERESIPHHMIDIIEPHVSFSVAEYVKQAHSVIEEIVERGKNVVVVGGTGLYINSLINDIDFTENDSDTSIREELSQIAEEKGVDYLVEMLCEFDEESAKRIHKNNVRRIIRAIEFYKMTGIPISVHQEETKKKESRYTSLNLGIKWDMPKLYERIEIRVDEMIEAGLLDEVKSLLDRGYTPDMISMQGIGYKELIEHIMGKCTLLEAIDKIKLGTRHYAKRQMTWFRRNESMHWIDYNDDITKKAKEILSEHYMR